MRLKKWSSLVSRSFLSSNSFLFVLCSVIHAVSFLKICLSMANFFEGYLWFSFWLLRRFRGWWIILSCNLSQQFFSLAVSPDGRLVFSSAIRLAIIKFVLIRLYFVGHHRVFSSFFVRLQPSSFLIRPPSFFAGTVEPPAKRKAAASSGGPGDPSPKHFQPPVFGLASSSIGESIVGVSLPIALGEVRPPSLKKKRAAAFIITTPSKSGSKVGGVPPVDGLPPPAKAKAPVVPSAPPRVDAEPSGSETEEDSSEEEDEVEEVVVPGVHDAGGAPAGLVCDDIVFHEWVFLRLWHLRQ